MELKVTGSEVTICDPAAVSAADALLAIHQRATVSGTWVVDPEHWDGLPDGHTRATTSGPVPAGPATDQPVDHDGDGLAALLKRSAAAQIPVARRPLAAYDLAAGLNPTPIEGLN